MVHQLDVHTVGGVVSAGQQIMLIVPAADKLIVEAKVQPQDIDQVRIGQAAVMRFVQFQHRARRRRSTATSRGIGRRDAGSAHRAQLLHGPDRGPAGRVRAARGEYKLIPGMPVEVFIQTTIRTVVSYFVRPFQDQIARTFREK